MCEGLLFITLDTSCIGKKETTMFKFLLVMFLISPEGEIGMIKAPESSYESCQKHGIELTNKATAAGYIALGTCVKPGDYIADS